MNKDQLIQWLTVNCACWKGDKSKEILNTLDETTLNNLKTNSEKAKAFDPLKSVVVNIGTAVGFKESDPLKLASFVTNQMAEKDKKVTDAEDAAKKAGADKEKTTTNANPLTRSEVLVMLKGLSDKEWLDIAPPSINKFVETAKDVDKRERFRIMNLLTANVSNKEEKEAKLLKLKDKDLNSLNELLEFATINGKLETPPNDDQRFLADFFGAQGSGDPQTQNQRKTGRDKPATDGAPLVPSLWSVDTHLTDEDAA